VRPARALLSAVLLCLLAGAAVLVASPASSVPSNPASHVCQDGLVEQYTVPAGVTQIRVDAAGAQGGRGDGNPSPGSAGSSGGLGGAVAAVFTVVPGQVLDVEVACAGGDGLSPGIAGLGGEGAGTGGDGGATTYPGGGGGGSSQVADSGTDTVLVVAGGGGGGAAAGGIGGAGGGPNQPGADGGEDLAPNCQGRGGTNAQAGAGGSAAVNGSAGSGAEGGDGGDTATPNAAASGGGGGGRFAGGGGGSTGGTIPCGGAGGGAGYVASSGTVVGGASGVQAGSGYVDIYTQTFTDVGFSHTFFTDIEWMANSGISTGFQPGPTYRPSTDVTRQAMSAFLYRLAGEPPFKDPVVGSFTDVPLGSTFFHEIEWMADEGITTGFPGGVYRPAQAVSRQAMSAFLYRFAGEPAVTLPPEPTFADVPADSQFYDEIEWMADTGISTGFQPGPTYRPSAAVTRQAMSAFLHRLDELPT
jgi:hypothetical protein